MWFFSADLTVHTPLLRKIAVESLLTGQVAKNNCFLSRSKGETGSQQPENHLWPYV